MAKIKFIAVRSGTLLAPIDEDGENAIKSLSNEESYSVTINPQRKPTYFSRWMNLVNNFLLGICICRNNIVYL